MARKATKKTTSRASGRTAKPALIDEIRALVELMSEQDLSEIHIEDSERKIELKRGGVAPVAPAPHVQAPVPAPPAPQPAATGGESAAAPEPQGEHLVEIKSPMVGTFYAASSPDGDPYVRVGDEVDEGTVVCIVEAMKVMNTIEAECSGTITEVCAQNAQPVEFGQVLFRVRPA